MIHVIKAGMFTTIQDQGRYGYQKDGVVVSGAADRDASRIANMLVNNPENAPLLEVTLQGPVLEFESTALVSICGANLSPMLNGSPIPMWKPFVVQQGDELRFGSCKNGLRAYIAIGGGLDIEPVLHSTSTYVRAGIGGVQGRALDVGDKISFSSVPIKTEKPPSWSVAQQLRSTVQPEETIRFFKGKEYDLFTKESQLAFVSEPYTIDAQSDRMGARLNGPALYLSDPFELLSEAVTHGTIQVPADGNPILLLADCQTTGGYPKLAQVAAVDHSKIAQLKPGDSIRFKEISYEEAWTLFVQKEKDLRTLSAMLRKKFRSGGVKHVHGYQL